jgi:hypothetical protein
LVTSTNVINTTFYEKLSFDLIRDIAPIAGIASVPNVMEINRAREQFCTDAFGRAGHPSASSHRGEQR